MNIGDRAVGPSRRAWRSRMAALVAIVSCGLAAAAVAPAAGHAWWNGQAQIESASWYSHPGIGWTLVVKPTTAARHLSSYGAGVAGWDELYSRYRNSGLNTNLGGMKDQFICHQQFVTLWDRWRATWNLDEWRPDVSYWWTVAQRCNPGGGID